MRSLQADGAPKPLTCIAHSKPHALSSHALLSRYYVGLLVLLHSLARLNGAEPDCGEVLIIWHPSFEETVLSPRQRTELSCVSGTRQVRYVRVDDERAALWQRVPTRCNCSEASASLLKLETFYMERRDHAIIFLDSDMLVLQPLNRIAMWMSYRANSSMPVGATPTARNMHGTWFLHGSAHRGSGGALPSAIQLGFHAFVQPAPTDLRDALTRACLTLIERNKIKGNLDQDVVGLALRALGERDEPKRFNRSKRLGRARPRQLFLHGDWHVRATPTAGTSTPTGRASESQCCPLSSLAPPQTNYFPLGRPDINKKKAIHWAGHPKPWSCAGRRRDLTYFGTNGKGRSQEFYAHVRSFWQAECNRTVLSGCTGSAGWGQDLIWLQSLCGPSCTPSPSLS